MGRKYGLGKYGRGTYDLGGIVLPPWIPIASQPDVWTAIPEVWPPLPTPWHPTTPSYVSEIWEPTVPESDSWGASSTNPAEIWVSVPVGTNV